MVVRDAKKQRVLLNGLDQDIFQSFISTTTRTPYASYDLLLKDLLHVAATPHMIKKLALLRPGLAQSVLSTQAQGKQGKQGLIPTQAKSPTDRLASIEAILATYIAKPRDGQGGRHRDGQRQSQFDCDNWADHGSCNNTRCPYSHAGPKGTHPPPVPGVRLVCANHPHSKNHTTARSRSAGRKTEQPAQGSAQQVNAAVASYDADYSFDGGDPSGDLSYAQVFTTRAMPEYVISMAAQPKIDLWVVDGASTTFATYDRNLCTNIRKCNVKILGPNASNTSVCTETGDCDIATRDPATGAVGTMRATDVLISENFPFHIFSEIICFEKRCTATKALNSWQFYSPAKKPLFHASQQLLASGVKLYFIDANPPTSAPPPPSTSTTSTCLATATVQGAPLGAYYDNGAAIVMMDPTPKFDLKIADKLKPNIPVLPALGSTIHSQRSSSLKKINPAKNLQLLLELHCAFDHWNFAAIAAKFGLTLPSPPPDCWACLLSKPRRLTPDKVSTRIVTRVSEGFSADAKGPILPPTPEGYQYFFLIMCLYSHFFWLILAESQAQ